MELTERQNKLLQLVKVLHGVQVRKYTEEPYWTHPLAVAVIVNDYHIGLAAEVALCHDLFEDTDCVADTLTDHLYRIGYSVNEIGVIIRGVVDLTDVFTTEAFPYLNRRIRKECESKRLGSISYLAQTVKYADLIHNTESIVENDPNFSKVYLMEKAQMLIEMNDGNEPLRKRCVEQLKTLKTK